MAGSHEGEDKEDTAIEDTENSEDDGLRDLPVDSAEGERSESEMAKDVGPQGSSKMASGGDEAGGGEGGTGRSGRRETVRQDATAIMMDKAWKPFAKGIMVRGDAKKFLKDGVKTFLGQLLCRAELAGSLDPKMVKNAIDVWIPKKGDVGEKMRSVPPSPQIVI
jgi:hypothetical protein